MRPFVSVLGCATLLGLLAIPAQATPIQYEFVLTVQTASGACPDPQLPNFPCGVLPGDQFFGSFSTAVDVSGFADGVYPTIPLDSWMLTIGSNIWDMNLPRPQSQFVGFRDPGLSGINPGLIVSSGAITGFLGG